MDKTSAKLIVNSSAKGLKLRNLVTFILTIILLFAVVFPFICRHYKVTELKSALKAAETEYQAQEAKAEKEGQKASRPVDGYIKYFDREGGHIFVMRGGSENSEKLWRLRKNMIATQEAIQESSTLSVWHYCLVVVGLCGFLIVWPLYWGAVRSTKDYLEIDFSEGKIHFVEHYIFGYSEEEVQCFDTLISVSVDTNCFSKDTGVAALSFKGKFIVAGDVSKVECELTYCDKYAEVIEAIQQHLKSRGLDAVKVQMVNPA